MLAKSRLIRPKMVPLKYDTKILSSNLYCIGSSYINIMRNRIEEGISIQGERLSYILNRISLCFLLSRTTSISSLASYSGEFGDSVSQVLTSLIRVTA